METFGTIGATVIPGGDTGTAGINGFAGELKGGDGIGIAIFSVIDFTVISGGDIAVVGTDGTEGNPKGGDGMGIAAFRTGNIGTAHLLAIVSPSL